MENLIIDWRDSTQIQEEVVIAPTFLQGRFVVKNNGAQYCVEVECIDSDGFNGTHLLCIAHSSCEYRSRDIAIVIANALRLYYARL